MTNELKACEKQALVVFCNIASWGHVNPTLPVVTQLTLDAQCRVSYFVNTSSDSELARKIEACGASVHIYNNDVSWKPSNHNPHRHAFLSLQPAAVAILPWLLVQLESLRPALIVYDHFAVWGKYAGTILGIPTLCSVGWLVGDDDDLAHMSSACGKTELLIPSDANFESEKMLQEKYQICTSWEHSLSEYSETANMVYTIPSLQSSFNTRYPKSSFHFLGPTTSTEARNLENMNNSLLTEVHEAIGKGTTVIYVSLGTELGNQIGFWRKLSWAMSHAEFKATIPEDIMVVCSVGGEGHIKDVKSLFAEAIVEAVVPQLQLLNIMGQGKPGETRPIFVTHGGINSVHESLLCGIPMLCIPHVGDQLAMANQVNELGAGHMIDSCMCNTQTLRAGLVEMAKNYSTYGNAAKRLQGSLQRAPGASGAAMLITQHLR
eukprot:m.153889 g.153889  ORF g.153889 m.153889 type:complete len:434 (+) comp15074_c0_seq5:2161-3462(+)